VDILGEIEKEMDLLAEAGGSDGAIDRIIDDESPPSSSDDPSDNSQESETGQAGEVVPPSETTPPGEKPAGEEDGEPPLLAGRFPFTEEGIEKLEGMATTYQSRSDRAESLLTKAGFQKIEDEEGNVSWLEPGAEKEPVRGSGFGKVDMGQVDELVDRLVQPAEPKLEDVDPTDLKAISKVVQAATRAEREHLEHKERVRRQLVRLMEEYPNITGEEVIKTLEWAADPRNFEIRDLHALRTGKLSSRSARPSEGTPGKAKDAAARKAAALAELEATRRKRKAPAGTSEGGAGPDEGKKPKTIEDQIGAEIEAFPANLKSRI